MEPTQDELREIFKAWSKIHDEAWDEEAWLNGERIKRPPYPDILRQFTLTCGAKTRKGTPCKRVDLYSNGRCKLHGGLSTGPTTKEGKKKSAMNGFKTSKTRTP